tara:strand:- start:7266 stop:8279 length:1014 start_codon:yes stop_codon:yes gene_type:complete
MILPDQIPLYIALGLLHYATAYPDFSTAQAAWVAYWGWPLVIAIVFILCMWQLYALFIEPITRPKLVMKKDFQNKVEGKIVWIKGASYGFFYAYWKFWARLYRTFPRFMGRDYQIGVMLFTYGLVRALQSTHFALMEVNLFPAWGPEVGIWGRLSFYSSLIFLFGHIITARDDFPKLKGNDPYHIALGRRITTGKIIYFRQTGQYLPQLVRCSQLWLDDKVPLKKFWGRVVVESANIALVPSQNLDYFVLHHENDAPVTMEDWEGVTHLVSNDLRGSQKLVVSASASDPDVLKRQQERTTFMFNPDWEKMLLEMAEADGEISPGEAEILDRYKKESN